MIVVLVAAAVLVGVFAGRGARAAARRERARGRLVAGAARSVARDRLPAAPRWLIARLDDAAVATDARVIAAAWIAALALGPAAALVAGGPGLAGAVAAAISAGPWLVLRFAAGRRSARIDAALPVALESIARALRTGGSLRQAVAEVAAATRPPLGDDLDAVAAMVARGAPLTIALETWVEQRPLAGVRLAAAALALGAETGGAQAHAVDGVAATIRERLAAAAEIRAQATQARASGAVIALAPLAFCALASATDPRTAAFLFRTPAGTVLLIAGLALDALGAVWMNRITKVAL